MMQVGMVNGKTLGFTSSTQPTRAVINHTNEGATILFLDRIGIAAPQALSISLICGALPLLSGAIGGILFLTRRLQKRRR